VRSALKSEFRRIDPTSARVVLVDMANRVLGSFSESLSAATKKRLEVLGVEVRLGRGVDQIDENGVIVAGERIAAKTVIWTAGVTPSPAGKWLAVETDRARRVCVDKDLSVPGHAEVFALGDTASFEQDGKPLPGVAQEQGSYVGKSIHRRIVGQSPLPPLRYFDRGSMAVVGKRFAVLQTGKLQLSGLAAWLVWGAVHLEFLAQRHLRVSVFLQWVWTGVTGQRGSRLIPNLFRSACESRPQAEPRPNATPNQTRATNDRTNLTSQV
jgi:NADH:ubiquinone reductase (H+-translocating)